MGIRQLLGPSTKRQAQQGVQAAPCSEGPGVSQSGPVSCRHPHTMSPSQTQDHTPPPRTDDPQLCSPGSDGRPAALRLLARGSWQCRRLRASPGRSLPHRHLWNSPMCHRQWGRYRERRCENSRRRGAPARQVCVGGEGGPASGGCLHTHTRTHTRALTVDTHTLARSPDLLWSSAVGRILFPGLQRERRVSGTLFLFFSVCDSAKPLSLL